MPKKIKKSHTSIIPLSPQVTIIMNTDTQIKEEVVKMFKEILPGLEKILNK